MNISNLILPYDEPCSATVTNPMNAMMSLGALAQMLRINPSARALGDKAGLKSPFSLREALLKGTCLALQPEMIEPPPYFVQPSQENRLLPALRVFARSHDPRKTLVSAAIESIQGNAAIAMAIADLAVTGRTSYENFKPSLTEAMLVPDVKASLASSGLPIPSDADIMSALKNVLDRVYEVAFALRGPYPARAAVRRSLGWIAVSGEDDPPHRPVNMTSAPYPQYEIPVTVGAVTVKTRFFIASPPLPADRLATTQMPSPGRSLPPDATPLVPDGDRVILFIHGHSSGAEEALDLIPWLHQAGIAQGMRFSIISMDLPCNGYSEMIEHSQVAPSNETTYPGGKSDHALINTPILDFLENFIVAFVDCLDGYTRIKNRFAGVIGGSLGGSMGLRLGRLDWAWLANGIVSWSPASVWSPMVNDEIKRRGPDHCRDKWDEVENEAFSRINHFSEVFERDIVDSQGARNLDRWIESMLMGPQAGQWHRPHWPCTDAYLHTARMGRREIYNPYFRRWHWRVAGEQLVYSHVDNVIRGDKRSPFRYELNHVRQFLITGNQDNNQGTNIFDATRKLAVLMVNTPGKSLFLDNTGHSIQDERPHYLADQIVSFLTVEAP